MPNGTEIKLFAPRLHNTNAEAKLLDAEHSMEYIKQTMIWLAASTPSSTDGSVETIHTIESLLDEYSDAVLTHRFAREMIDYPQDCVDELA